MSIKRLLLTAASLAGVVALAACSTPAASPSSPSSPAATSSPSASPSVTDGPEVRFGSYVDTEGQVVGAAIVQLLRAGGVNVVDKTKFGTPDVVRKAYLQGDLSGALDYTGSGAFYIGPESDPLWSDATKGYEQVKKLDLEQNGIVWLSPAPANNTESIAVKREFATEHGLTTIDDLAAYVNSGGKIKLIGNQEWLDREYGLQGIQKAYGFTLAKEDLIGLSDGNTAQFIKAVANGTDGVNAAEVYATDGGLAELDLVVLTDTKSIPPVYNPTPVFRKEIIDAYPQIPAILEPFTKTLTIEALQQLNKAVAVDGQDPKVVAEQYLTANGLLG